MGEMLSYLVLLRAQLKFRGVKIQTEKLVSLQKSKHTDRQTL